MNDGCSLRSRGQWWERIRQLLGGSLCVDLGSDPSLCSHHLTHQSMIMAKRVANSWTIIGKTEFVIWFGGAGNCGLWATEDQEDSSRLCVGEE